MVFFTCNACNESLKKNQVEKHYLQKCRRCEFLSCVDCGKEFWGDSYQSHIKCISEDEKYSGKNYVAKVNKGEVKQEQWIQKVQSAIQKASDNPKLKDLLQRLEEYPNIPRKKAKFENFLRCSLRVLNVGLQNQVWDLLMAEAQHKNNTESSSGTGTEINSSANENATAEQTGTGESTETVDRESERSKNKRERKEERRKKMHKAEKKDIKDTEKAEADVDKKIKRKRKLRNEDMEEENPPPEKKRAKEEERITDENNATHENGNEAEDNALCANGKREKFDWAATIISVLKSKGEISINKLRKKVLTEYASYGSNKPEEKVMAKFNKKLSTLRGVKILKDRAKLIQS